jgi:enamine deaminase RidA (YjgF/YER057c/UK114 family)
MIERINPFQFSSFGHYSQGVKSDLGPKTMVLVAGQIAWDDDGTPRAPWRFYRPNPFHL